MNRLPDRIRKLLRVDETTGCWLFTGKWTTGNGYGKTKWRGSHRVLHRVVWEIVMGHICPGFLLDHTCRVRSCCNPAHLAPVPPVINVLRGDAVLFKQKDDYECQG